MISTKHDGKCDLLSKRNDGGALNIKTVESTKFLPSILKNDKMVQQKLTKQGNRRTLDAVEDSFIECDRIINSGNLKKSSISSKDNFKGTIGVDHGVNVSGSVTNVKCNSDINTDNYESFVKHSKLEESLRKSLEIGDDKPNRYEKGTTKSTTHLILEMNEFYFDMAEQLRYLKGNLQSTYRGPSEDELSETSDWNYATTDPRLLRIIEKIGKDETKMAECVKILRKEKEERLAIEDEICSIVDCPIGEGDGLADDYLHVTCFQSPDGEDQNLLEETVTETEPTEDLHERKTKRTNRNEKDFVEKNKKLAKEYTMSRYCLTDEEKIKLDMLLADIDECGDMDTNQSNTSMKSITTEVNIDVRNEERCQQQNCDIKSVDDDDEVDDENEQAVNRINGFKLELDEESLLSDVDSKLKVVTEMAEGDEVIDLKDAESKGKYWKLQLMQKRLKTIDSSLVELQQAKDKESEDVKEFEENYDEVERNVREKSYRESLKESGLKLEDIEREIELESNENDEKIVNDDEIV